MALTRTQLVVTHLVISAIIVTSFILFAVLQWCPPPLTAATGLVKVLLILFCVDVVLGPILCLFFVKPARSSYRFDLATVICLQLVAFVFGAWSIYQGRPAYLVFALDRFEVVAASQIESAELAKVKHPEFKVLPQSGPVFVYAEQPNDPVEKQRILFSSMSGADLQVFPQYYRPYQEHAAEVLGKSHAIEELLKLNPEAKARLEDLQKKFARQADRFRYIPLVAKQREMSVLIDAKSAEILEIVDLRPWK
ncbi:hypothetical protein GCM10027046_19430 [Uliginosibacterium flavum]|uniref:TfpX/TfpZ family type IV pilin accessory protein n=1 Tax=Uliginosibacterium flavum TaxID=1396831 RepID=A0ABV2TFS3_9RHOO